MYTSPNVSARGKKNQKDSGNPDSNQEPTDG